MSKRTRTNSKHKKKAEKQQRKMNCKDESYSSIYSVSTYLISLSIFLISSFFDRNTWKDYITIGIFLLVFPICFGLVRFCEKKSKRLTEKNKRAIYIIVEIGTNIGYLNPILLLLIAVSGIFKEKWISILLAFVVVFLSIAAIVPVAIKNKSHNRIIEDFNDNSKEIKAIAHNIQCRPFKLVLFVIIAVLLFKICTDFSVINITFDSLFNSSYQNAFQRFFKNDYVVNILCTIITATALYGLQIKYSKYKLKKDFRCNEIISGLYEGIKCAYRIKSKADETVFDSSNENDFHEKRIAKAKKYYEFYIENNVDFHESHLMLTYPNNDILIESIQMVFFLNLNFRLLDIVNNIKNRKPNLEREYPNIESLVKVYEEKKRDSDLISLGYMIEDYIVDVGFMGQYCLKLLDYLGYDPIPVQINISVLNTMYPSDEELIGYLHLKEKERAKVSKQIIRKSFIKYIFYKIKKFFSIEI